MCCRCCQDVSALVAERAFKWAFVLSQRCKWAVWPLQLFAACKGACLSYTKYSAAALIPIKYLAGVGSVVCTILCSGKQVCAPHHLSCSHTLQDLGWQRVRKCRQICYIYSSLKQLGRQLTAGCQACLQRNLLSLCVPAPQLQLACPLSPGCAAVCVSCKAAGA